MSISVSGCSCQLPVFVRGQGWVEISASGVAGKDIGPKNAHSSRICPEGKLFFTNLKYSGDLKSGRIGLFFSF